MQNKAFFLKRLNDHVQYLRQMKARLDGNNQFEPTSCRICALGEWLYGEGMKYASEHSEIMLNLFHALLEPHERFHAVSEEALRCQQAGDELGMRRALTEMHTLSTTLINILLKMDAIPVYTVDVVNVGEKY